MRSLCSRAARAPFCSCRASAHGLTSALRRRFSAAVDRRARPTCDIFTANRPSNVAVAAALRSHHRHGSGSCASRSTADVRKGAVRLREFTSLVDHNPRPRHAKHTPLNAIDALISICKTEASLDRHVAGHRNFLKFLQTIHRISDPEGRLSPSSIRILRPNLSSIHDAVHEEARDGDDEARLPLTNAQFEKYHGMINRLVNKLIIQSYYDEIPDLPEKARRNLESLDSAWTAIRMLRSEGYPRYLHPNVDPAAAKEQQDKLMSIIQTLFDEWNLDRRKAKPKFQIAKICYNLLVCPYPPNIHHYNLLLSGFSQKHCHNLTEIVAASLLEDSRLRPTTQTIVCLLSHYELKDDIRGFYHVIRRMMALDNRGILIRRRWFEDVLKYPILRPWARLPEVTTSLKANWVIERPVRRQEIYETLVAGLLSFGRVKDAVKIFIASLQERQGTSVELFISLLQQCLYKLDASAADILLRGLVDNTAVIASLLIRDNCPPKLAEHLYPILNMGNAPAQPLSEERAAAASQLKIMATLPEESGKMQLLNVAMLIRQTDNHLRRLKKIGARMAPLLDLDYPVASRHEVVLCGINELNKLMQHYQHLAGKLLKHQVLLKTVKRVEELTWDIAPSKIQHIYERLVPVVGRALPLPLKEGVYGNTERFRDVSVTAEAWMRYRISRMHGIVPEERRLIMEARLALLVGRRLQDEAQELAQPGAVGWRQLELRESDAEAQRATHVDGNNLDDFGLWSEDEAVVAWATGRSLRAA